MVNGPLTLAAFWHRNKSALPSYARVVAMAHAGELQNVKAHDKGFGFVIEGTEKLFLGINSKELKKNRAADCQPSGEKD